MILVFFLTVASAVHTRLLHGDFTLKAFNQPNTVEVMHRIEKQQWLSDDYFRRYFDFVRKSDSRWYVRTGDIEASFKFFKNNSVRIILATFKMSANHFKIT